MERRESTDKQQQLTLRYNQRLLFIGKTRSGKSFLSRALMQNFARDKDLQIIIIDPKHEWKKFGKGDSLSSPRLVTKYMEKVRIQIFQTFTWIPALDEMIDKILLRGKAIVIFDELGGLADANKVPDGIMRLWSQGGGKGVGAWALIQRPKRVPLIIKEQSEVFFMFRIISLEQRKAIQDFISDIRVIEQALPKFYFWVYEEGWDKAILARPIKQSVKLS
jgi:hypothetical protein